MVQFLIFFFCSYNKLFDLCWGNLTLNHLNHQSSDHGILEKSFIFPSNSTMDTNGNAGIESNDVLTTSSNDIREKLYIQLHKTNLNLIWFWLRVIEPQSFLHLVYRSRYHMLFEKCYISTSRSLQNSTGNTKHRNTIKRLFFLLFEKCLYLIYIHRLYCKVFYIL